MQKKTKSQAFILIFYLLSLVVLYQLENILFFWLCIPSILISTMEKNSTKHRFIFAISVLVLIATPSLYFVSGYFSDISAFKGFLFSKVDSSLTSQEFFF